MTGEVNDYADELAVGVPGADDADLRIDGRGVAGDVGVHRAGVAPGPAVFHALAAVEGDLVLLSETEAERDGREPRVGEAHGLDDFALDGREVGGIGERGFLVGEALDVARCAFELRQCDDTDRARRVRMRGRDQHGAGREAGGAGDAGARAQHDLARDDQGVERDERDPREAVVEDGGADLAGIDVRLEDVARNRVGLAHADCRRDVALGETGADGGGGVSDRERQEE